MLYALGLQFKMRTMIEKHIQETIIHRLPDLTEIPEEMWAELKTGFDGSGNNFTVIDFHALLRGQSSRAPSYNFSKQRITLPMF